MNTSFDLQDEQKELALKEIKQFFEEYRDEAIGDLAAMLVLDFITEKFGPFYYNIGLADAKTFIQDKIEDMYSLEK